MCQQSQVRRLELEFGRVSEFGNRWRMFKGNYLTCCLYVEMTLVDKRGERHQAAFTERFALDTGSPVTFLRKKIFVQAIPVCFEELGLEEVPFGGRETGEGSYEKMWKIERMRFPQFGLVLEEAYISAEDRPFSLLGTDFLEHFQMWFDPETKRACLWLHPKTPE